MNFVGSPEDNNTRAGLLETNMSSGEPVTYTSDMYDYISLFHSIFTIAATNKSKNLFALGSYYTDLLLNSNNIDPIDSYQKWYPFIMEHINSAALKSKCLYCDNHVSRKEYQVCNQHIPKCNASLKSTGITCTSNALPNSHFCGRHIPRTQVSKPATTPDVAVCSAVIQSGINKGSQCTRSAKQGSSFCGVHKNYIQPTTPIPVQKVKVLNQEEINLIQLATWTPDEFSRIKSLRLFNPIYNDNKTLNYQETIAQTTNSIQRRFNKITTDTLRDITSANLISGEYLRMEQCDKVLTELDNGLDGECTEHFDNRLKMIEECKYYKKLLNKAFVTHKHKLSRLPTNNINIPVLPNVDEIMFNFNRCIKVRTEMRISHSKDKDKFSPTPIGTASFIYAPTVYLPSDPETLPPVYSDTLSPASSPPVRCPATPIVFTPSSSPVSSPPTPVTKLTTQITLPFPIDGSVINDPKYASDNQGLLNRYDDLAVYCESLVNADIEGELLDRAKSYMRATYSKLRARKVQMNSVYVQYH
jgi:hypothetical protein